MFNPARASKSRLSVFVLAVCLLPLLALGSAWEFSESTSATSLLSNLLLRNNLHVVTPEEFYRSAQMNKENLRRTLLDHGIRTIVDLRRGTVTVGDSVLRESDFAADLGINYYRVPLNSRKAPTIERVQALLSILHRAEKPILVHCSSGTHRTGFASLLWLLELQRIPLEIALGQLSLRYGYSAWERRLKAAISKAEILDDSVLRFAEEHRRSGIDFPSWAAKNLPSERDPDVLETLKSLQGGLDSDSNIT